MQYKWIGVHIHPPDPSLLTVLESRKNNTEELSSASVGTHLHVLQWLSAARHVDVNCLLTGLRGKHTHKIRLVCFPVFLFVCVQSQHLARAWH